MEMTIKISDKYLPMYNEIKAKVVQKSKSMGEILGAKRPSELTDDDLVFEYLLLLGKYYDIKN